LREKIVARVTGGDLHLVGFGAEADDGGWNERIRG
jgi:hypothetical protein